MSKVGFVAALCVMAGSCLLLGAIATYEHLQFWWDGQSAIMVGNDPMLERAGRVQQFDAMVADVAYQSDSGTIQVADKSLSGEWVRKLSQGDSIPIRYLQSDPYRVMAAGDELPNPWGWLILGAITSVVAMIAWRKLRQETHGE